MPRTRIDLPERIEYRKKNTVVLTFCGDGATSEGDFHEGLNFAGVLNTPTIFLCQNNHWAISLPRAKQTKSKTLAQKALLAWGSGHGAPSQNMKGSRIEPQTAVSV
jgi:TPP-dependent pyruvate/acetoin dehydrogenase alpha subunit